MLLLSLEAIAVLLMIIGMALMIFIGVAALLGLVLAAGTWIEKIILKIKNK